MTDPPLVLTDLGLSCPAGEFHVNPWRPVDRAVITEETGTIKALRSLPPS